MDYKNYQDNEFEQFLQDEVSQHRMYPSDQVWAKIRTDVHGNPNWHALTFISLFIICSLTASTLLMSPSANVRFTALKTAPLAQKAIAAHKVASATSTEPYLGVIEPQIMTNATIVQIEENQLLAQYSQHAITGNSPEPTLPYTAVRVKNESAHTASQQQIPNAEQRSFQQLEPLNLKPIPVKEEKPSLANTEKPNLLKTISTDKEPIILEDEYLKKIVANTKKIAWNKLSKLGFQVYATPSKSYRTLSDADVKEIIQPNAVAASGTQNIPLGLNYSAGVNDIVRHRAATGVEIGFAALYKINNRLKFKAGFQLNVRQYNIETFKIFNRDLSTLSLINNGGIQTINLLSSYNNNAGYKAEQLNNKSYQVSLPIGVQWEILKGNRMSLNAEASVQPTYTINHNSYLLSTDYKNYTEGNNYLRRWNVNTSAGINFSYKSGANIWQIGPQLRYQHLPTYSNQYPLKEHLMDYGIRLGITRQWK